MRELTKRCFSVLLACLIVSTAVFGAVQYRENRYSPVQEGDGAVVLAAAAGAGIAAGYVAAEYFDKDVDVESIKQQEARETKVGIYQSAGTQQQNNEVLLDSLANHLNDARLPARVDAKTAAIRAMNNDSSLAEAKAAAREEVEEEYARKQAQLWVKYETSIEVYQNLRAKASNTSNVSSNYVQGTGSPGSDVNYGGEIHFGSTSVTFVNQSSRTTTVIEAPGHYTSSNSRREKANDYWISGESHDDDRRSYQVDLKGLTTGKPDSGYENPPLLLDYDRFRQQWQHIEEENDRVEQQVVNFVENTYDGYTAGEISNEEMIDPYVAARNYSPEGQYGTWTLYSLATTGKGFPSDLDGIKKMTVSTPGYTYNGTLLSDGLPAGDSFTVGTQYNASNLDGEQLVLTNDGNVETLSDTFTIEAAYTMNGTRMNTSEIAYRNLSYNTTTIDGFRQASQAFRDTQRKINKRQENLTTASAGPGWLDWNGLGTSLPYGGAGVVVVLGALVVLGLVTRN